MAIATPSTAVEFECPSAYRQEIKARANRVRWLVVPGRRYLEIDGTDVPGGEGFRDALGSLYPVAYTLHFALRKRGVDAPVGALEGLYWMGEPGPINAAQFLASPGARGAWNWRLLLPVPDEATDGDVAAATDAVRSKKAPPLLDKVRCEAWDEGTAAQLMHVGPYAHEAATVERLHEAIREAGLRLRGCHHEIYISDPNRTRPENIKTVIRQPVEQGG